MNRAQRTLIEEAARDVHTADHTPYTDVRERALSSADEHVAAARKLGRLTPELAQEAMRLCGAIGRHRPPLHAAIGG